VRLFVGGVPKQKSYHKGSDGRVIPNAGAMAWQETIEKSLLVAKPWEPLQGAISVQATFLFPAHVRRPAWARSWGSRYPKRTKPDLDKLCRPVLDALERVGVIPNDSRVMELVAVKLHVDTKDGEETGLELVVSSS
jgi:Holliday junction resolvase RusA-like endonuclease